MKAQSADGVIHEFPDDTPREVIDRAMKAYANKPMSWGDVGSQAIENIGPSAAKMAGDIAQPFIHPIETAKNLGGLAVGSMEKLYENPATRVLGGANPAQAIYNQMRSLGIVGDTGAGKKVEAVGDAFKERYGGIENFKRTLAKDPVGVIADLSMLMSGGGTAAARAPGMVGRIGRIATKVGELTDPIQGTAKAAKAGGSLAAEVIGGMGTQTGAESLRTAYRAGEAGGARGQAFREALRDQTPMGRVVEEARGAVSKLREERGDAYRSGMIPVANDKTILSFNDLDTALQKGTTAYKGVETNPAAEAVRRKMWDAVEEWKNLQASEYHTAEGFDALKQKLGAIRESTQYGTKARTVANEIYHAARKTITAQAPEYAKVMKGYEDASKQIKELERTLTGNPEAPIDTALRKLQSVLRDNVYTGYGRRKELADLLVRSGAPHLMERLAGQALKPWTPRGLGKLLGGEIIAAGAGALGAGVSGAGGAALATLPFMSPRLMGEAAYKTGQIARYPTRVGGAVAPYGRPMAALGRLEQLQADAQERLMDKSKPVAKADRETLRAVAQGTATLDQRQKADALLRGASFDQRFGGRQPLRLTIRPRPQYGGVQ